MTLQPLERPSIAREFYIKLTRDPHPAAAIRRLVEATPPALETEWCEFKGAAQLTDLKIKQIWSEALAGFANTQGGVLVWGVDARKDPVTGIDAASGLSLVANPAAFKSRLNELHAQATDPPVLGVEIEAYSLGGSNAEGFVVCYIPESPFRPHRAESASRQYIIRAGDDFVAASVSLLRHLFFPQTRCFLVPALKARRVAQGAAPLYCVDATMSNQGSASAFDTFAITHYTPKGTPHNIETDWQTGPVLDPHHSRAKIPIHPGITTHFFEMTFGPQNLTKEVMFRIQIFAQNAEPAEWLFSFTSAEIQVGTEKRGERRSLFFRP
jgi:hypothetical protein